jgi:hypothetical protein
MTALNIRGGEACRRIRSASPGWRRYSAISAFLPSSEGMLLIYWIYSTFMVKKLV